MTVLELQKDVVYGPITSRRLGKSLGINLMPFDYKLCSFNCIYCHYGPTHALTCDVKKYAGDLPTAEQVIDRVEKVMRATVDYDYITFSGNGEPTLHPDFAMITERIRALKEKLRPNTLIALLSNSTGLNSKEVLDILPLIDYACFKVDAGDEDSFRHINKPAQAVDFNTIIDTLANLKGIYIQTVLMSGTPSNVSQNALDQYFRTIGKIRPEGVQIYSLDRPVVHTNITLVLPEELEKIARVGSDRTGVPFQYFHL